MRCLILFTCFLILALLTMDRKETRMGITRDVVDLAESGRYFDRPVAVSMPESMPESRRRETEEPVRITVFSRRNGEMAVNLSTPLPISLTEMAGVARYVGMLKVGTESGSVITPERARIQSMDRYSGLGLRWHIGDDRFLYCLPIRQRDDPTFKTALMWWG